MTWTTDLPSGAEAWIEFAVDIDGDAISGTQIVNTALWSAPAAGSGQATAVTTVGPETLALDLDLEKTATLAAALPSLHRGGDRPRRGS